MIIYQKRKNLKSHILIETSNYTVCGMKVNPDEYHVKIETDDYETATCTICTGTHEKNEQEKAMQEEYNSLMRDQFRWESVNPDIRRAIREMEKSLSSQYVKKFIDDALHDAIRNIGLKV